MAVDIPSGAPADSGELPGVAVQADYTVTFTAPKIGMLFGKVNDCCGQLLVRDIGSPWELIEQIGKGSIRWSEPREFAEFALPRKPQGNKGDYGHALIVAGSVGKSGAAVLCSWAALRVGAGLVTVATPEAVLPLVAAHTPEVMTEPLPATRSGSISLASIEHGYFDSIVKGKRALAIGPGLSTQSETQEFVRAVVGKRAAPIVLDADGLNAFAGRAAELNGPRGRLAITPHPGEMARLLGSTAGGCAGAAYGNRAQGGCGLELRGDPQRASDDYGYPGRLRVGEFDRQPGDGNGRHRRRAHRHACGACRAIWARRGFRRGVGQGA